MNDLVLPYTVIKVIRNHYSGYLYTSSLFTMIYFHNSDILLYGTLFIVVILNYASSPYLCTLFIASRFHYARYLYTKHANFSALHSQCMISFYMARFLHWFAFFMCNILIHVALIVVGVFTMHDPFIHDSPFIVGRFHYPRSLYLQHAFYSV